MAIKNLTSINLKLLQVFHRATKQSIDFKRQMTEYLKRKIPKSRSHSD